MSPNRASMLDRPVAQTFFRYGLPWSAAFLLLSSAGLVDTIFIGRYVGAQALAAVNIVSPVFSIFFGMGVMLSVGGTVRSAHHVGRGDLRAASAVFGRTMLLILLAGLVLGPWYGFFAAGIGSGLADLLAGYAHYVPGTFIIKGLVALVAALLLQPMLKKGEKIPFWRLALIELPSEVIMVAGYFGYKALILGKGLAAAASIPNNLVQAAVGIVGGLALYFALSKVPQIRDFSEAALAKKQK